MISSKLCLLEVSMRNEFKMRCYYDEERLYNGWLFEDFDSLDDDFDRVDEVESIGMLVESSSAVRVTLTL